LPVGVVCELFHEAVAVHLTDCVSRGIVLDIGEVGPYRGEPASRIVIVGDVFPVGVPRLRIVQVPDATSRVVCVPHAQANRVDTVLGTDWASYFVVPESFGAADT